MINRKGYAHCFLQLWAPRNWKDVQQTHCKVGDTMWAEQIQRPRSLTCSKQHPNTHFPEKKTNIYKTELACYCMHKAKFRRIFKLQWVNKTINFKIWLSQKKLIEWLSEIITHIKVIQKYSHIYAEVTWCMIIIKDTMKVKLHCLEFRLLNNHTKY